MFAYRSQGFTNRINPMQKKLDKKNKSEDLFAETTMTFGEHLEELRRCLFRAVLGLAIGFAIGLWAAKYAVPFIQSPLRNALSDYYQSQSETLIAENVEQLREAHYSLPEDPDELKKFVADRKLIFEKIYINPREVLGQLKRNQPRQPGDDTDGEQFDGEDLVPVYIWHLIEEDSRVQTKSLNAHEAFMIYIKAALVVGALLASPWIFYQIWAFVAAGLYPHEKHYIHVFLPISLGLFLAGAAMAFFFVFEPVLKFLLFFNQAMGIDPEPRISEWLGFVLVLPLGFGVSFQLPLVMLFLERIGIFDIAAYLSKWRIAILVIFVLAMFLTPADPTSMILMAGPLTVLYFGGILLCKLMPRSRSPFDELAD